MKNRKPCTLKGMTIAENIIAFVVLLAALTISGTGFYTAGNFINKGRMYLDAADTAQNLMESGMFDEVVEAFKDGAAPDTNNTYNSAKLKNKMKSLGYEFQSGSGYYYNKQTRILIKPFSSSDGNTGSKYTDSACVAATQVKYDAISGKDMIIDGDYDKLTKVKGMYLYICVPVDTEEMDRKTKQGYNFQDVLVVSDYVPLVYYIDDWPY